MNELSIKRWIHCVLSILFISITTVSHTEPVITDLYYDMTTLSDAELETDWTRHDGGATRGEIQISSANNTLHYTNTNHDLTNNNTFLFDAVISGSALGSDGELGARMWAIFRHAGMPPATFYHPEIRFVRQSSAYRIDLVDGTNSSVMASLNKDWTSVAPRFQVRLGHQQIGGIDYVVFQAEDSTLWYSNGRLINPDATNSTSVPLSSFGIAPGTGEFGFGNIISGVYHSEWESFRIIHSNEADTVLPPMPSNNPPEADAGPDQQMYAGETVALQGSATDPDDDLISGWQWEVISAPAASNYSLIYADTPEAVFTTDTVGDYLLTLTASDGILWSDPDAMVVIVTENQPPVAVASASPTTGPAPLEVHFDGTQSSDPEGDALYYDWNFDDLSFGTSEKPTHEYTAPGTYTAVLTVTDDFGNDDFDIIEIVVTAPNNPPVAAPSATPNEGQAPLVVQFYANASDSENDALTYLWDFGDPDSSDNSSTLADPVRVYEAPSTYTVTLTVSDGQEEVSESVTVLVSDEKALSTRRAKILGWQHGKTHKGIISCWTDITLPMPQPDDEISLTFDGIMLFDKQFSKFKPGLKPNVYLIVKRHLLVRINFNTNRMYVLKRKVNIKKFDNTDGVDVELKWGDRTAVDQFVMEQPADGLWKYKRENNTL